MPRATTDPSSIFVTRNPRADRTSSGGLWNSALLREVAAGGMASVFFLATVKLIPALPVTLLLAAGVYAGVRLLVSTAMQDEAAGSDALRAARSDLLAKSQRFHQLAERIRNDQAAASCRRLAQLLRDLVDHFERDPAYVDRARTFLDLQLPKAMDIVERYAFLLGQRHLDASGRRELEASERTLSLMERAFEEQHRRLLDQDVRDFSLDRRVFEELLRLDGSVVEELPDLPALPDAPRTEAPES